MKPSLEVLQNFTNSYFKTNPPIVKWDYLGEYLGKRVRSKSSLSARVIYLDPVNISLSSSKNFRTEWGFSHLSCAGLTLSKGEHYFLTLLYEIAYFKIKLDSMKDNMEVKEKLLKKVEEDLDYKKRNRKKLGKNPMSGEEKRKFLRKRKKYYLDHTLSLNRKEDEKDEEHRIRVKAFRAWFMGDYIDVHPSTEKLAIKEFKKRRKQIGKILSENSK